MDDQHLLRYSRQILLPQFGIEAQERLSNSHVLIIGAGGLGSPAAMYLAAAGIGSISIVDDDKVDLSNLQRQILHRFSDLGRPKVESARDTLVSINPDLQLTPLATRLDADNLAQHLAGIDLVLDCSDNFTTRFAVNDACTRHGIPLVSGAAIRFEGQLGVFDSRDPSSPCYRCLYKEGEGETETCADNGVLSPMVGIIGSMQALEGIKLLCGIGKTLSGHLLVFDGLDQEWRNIRLRKDPACPVCSA